MFIYITIDVNIKKVFDEFYPQLVSSLPMKDVLFVAHLLTVKLLPGYLKEEVQSQPTSAEAAACLLDKEIRPAIESGDNESFTILLSTMEAFRSIHLNKLAEAIKQEIEKVVIPRNEPLTGKNIRVM